MANRQGLTLIESTTRYEFPIAKDPKQPGRDIVITPRPWEDGDPKQYWKKPLHPFDGGLGPDKLSSENYNKYAKGNIDASNKGLLVPPPLLTSISSGYSAPNGGISATNGGASTTGAIAVESTLVSAGMVAGDIIIVTVAYNDADAATITDTGASLTAVTARFVNGSIGARIFSKIYTGTPVTYDFDFTNTTDVWAVTAFYFTGNASLDVLDQSDTGTDSTTPFTCPTITPVNDYEIVIGMVATAGTASFLATAPFTLTGSSSGSGGSGITIGMSYNIQTDAAAVTPEFTGTNATGVVAAFSLKSNKIGFSSISKFVNFNSKTYTFNNKSLVSVNSSYGQSVVKVFASAISDIAVFNNELFIGLGHSTKMWKMTTAEAFTEASDNTYAGKLAVVGKNLWRSTSNVLVSSCTTTPLTLSNWGTDYTAGDTTWAINILLEYDGVLWVGKENGFYTPDVNTDFWNQTPQLAQWPDSSNCKGSFVAKGYLWCPSLPGLLRISTGESLFFGPELSNRPSFRFHIHGGVEWSNSIFLAAVDHEATSQSCIIKMVLKEDSDGYIYYEWLRSGATTDIHCIGITPYTTNPSLLMGQSATVKYVKLGRGGGRDIDDSNYGYGLAWEIETGSVRPTEDLSVVSGLIGLIVVTDQDSSETIDTVQYKIEEGNYVNMLTDQESGSGAMPITNTSGYAAVTRYADKSTNQGQFFGFKLAGSLSDAHLGTDRPEIREMWAFGYVRTRYIDQIKVPIYAERNAIIGNGMRKGQTAGQTAAQLKRWMRDQTTLSFELADYEESRTTRGRIVEVIDEEAIVDKLTASTDAPTKILTIVLERDDFAGTQYNA